MVGLQWIYDIIFCWNPAKATKSSGRFHEDLQIQFIKFDEISHSDCSLFGPCLRSRRRLDSESSTHCTTSYSCFANRRPIRCQNSDRFGSSATYDCNSKCYNNYAHELSSKRRRFYCNFEFSTNSITCTRQSSTFIITSSYIISSFDSSCPKHCCRHLKNLSSQTFACVVKERSPSFKRCGSKGYKIRRWRLRDKGIAVDDRKEESSKEEGEGRKPGSCSHPEWGEKVK